MNLKAICIVACAVGAALLVGGKILPNRIERSTWTEEKAQRYAQAGNRFHQVAHEHGAAKATAERGQGQLHAAMNQPTTEADYKVAKQEWETQVQSRDNAIARGEFWANLLFGAGAVCVMAGGCGYFIVKNLED